jgi:ribulose-phosphate 3-epimerase
MDGVFVPNIMLCNEMAKGLRPKTSIPYDIHLMIVNPEQKIRWFDLRPTDIVSVHYESTPHVHRAVQEVKNAGGRAAVALNPATPVCSLKHLLADLDMVLIMTVNPGFAGQKLVGQTLEKIRETRRFLDEAGFDKMSLQVDGNCSFENAVLMREAGADCFVAGSSSIFSKGMTIKDAAKKLREAIR